MINADERHEDLLARARREVAHLTLEEAVTRRYIEEWNRLGRTPEPEEEPYSGSDFLAEAR